MRGKKLKIDVMVMGGGRFYKTLVYTYNPLFKVRIDEVCNFVFNRLPSLRNRTDIELVLYN